MGDHLTVGGFVERKNALQHRGSSIFRSFRSRMKKKNQQSLESTQRMIAMCKEVLVDEMSFNQSAYSLTEKVGTETGMNLYTQGEQLKHIDTDLERMDSDMSDAERNLDQLSWCGLCVPPWKSHRPRSKSLESRTTTTTNITKYRKHLKHQTITVQKQNKSDEKYITKITNDTCEEELESNLQDVGALICSLRNLACDMSTEIDTHNVRLDNINDKSDRLEYRLAAGNEKIQRIIDN